MIIFNLKEVRKLGEAWPLTIRPISTHQVRAYLSHPAPFSRTRCVHMGVK